MKLQIRIPAAMGEPDSSEVLAAADSAAAQKATAWTAPVYTGTDAGAHLFEVDAQPRMAGVSTANVASALLPPHVAWTQIRAGTADPDQVQHTEEGNASTPAAPTVTQDAQPWDS